MSPDLRFKGLAFLVVALPLVWLLTHVLNALASGVHRWFTRTEQPPAAQPCASIGLSKEVVLGPLESSPPQVGYLTRDQFVEDAVIGIPLDEILEKARRGIPKAKKGKPADMMPFLSSGCISETDGDREIREIVLLRSAGASTAAVPQPKNLQKEG